MAGPIEDAPNVVIGDVEEAVAALGRVWRALPPESDERFIYKMSLIALTDRVRSVPRQSREVRMEYRIIQGSSPDELVRRVNAAISDGWQLQGGICEADLNESWLWAQAMVKQQMESKNE